MAGCRLVRALTPTIWNGRWKAWGTTDFATWLACDWDRPRRETIFFAKLRTQATRVGFTAHDAQRVKRVLAARGVLVDEQGEARPAPPPVEARPLWRWGVTYVVLALLIAFLAQVAHYHPAMPPTVASHFDVRGDANGWAPRAVLTGAITAAGCLVAGLFLAIAFAMSRSAFAVAGRYLLWVAAATLVLLALVAHLTFRANLNSDPSIGPAAIYAVLVYVSALAAWAALFVRRVR